MNDEFKLIFFLMGKNLFYIMVFNCRVKFDLDSYMIVFYEWGYFCDLLDNKKII